ncbi:unnamed protein product [Cuscuta epithymum]|uniref:DUF4283 domain-containing protein n=1 Tax=Cuscuta epithymum TaxID=186058 RepID=A0AAV0EU18_9ASTE|nr:unnamed protein product [Cuscuta epithymum]
MGKSKQAVGDSSNTRFTRSKYAALQDLEEDFPSLNSGNNVKKAVVVPNKTSQTESEKQPTLDVMGAVSEALDQTPGGKKNAGTCDTIDIPIPGNIGTDAIKNAGQNKAAGQVRTLAENKAPWSNLFKDNRDPAHGIKLRYVPPKGETLDFGDRVLPSMVDMWGYCLVGHFTGKFPGLKAVHDLKATWGVRCLVRSHNKGWVIFKFGNEEDRLKVLHDGPYNVFGKLLMLKVLSEDFSFEDEEFLKVPIWVKFPKLPMKLWNDEAMSEVASMVGVPFTTDKITQERSNNEYARVLIEVDVSKPPPLSFHIRLPSQKVIKQSVLYETFPNFCFQCKEFGHHPFICKKLAKRDDGEREKEQSMGKNEKLGNEQTGPATAHEKTAVIHALTDASAASGAQGSAATKGAEGPAKGAPKRPAKGVEQPAKSAVVVRPAATLELPAKSAAVVRPAATLQQPAQGTATAAVLATTPAGQPTKQASKTSEAVLEDAVRVVIDESEVRQNDVVTKCEVINGKTLKLSVKPFRSVHDSVIRVDTSLRLTDDLDKKGLTFTAKCLEGLPGVTRKKGEVCFDSKFTTPFRLFFGFK